MSEPDATETEQETGDEVGTESRSSWVFYDEAPTLEQTRELLETLPPVWGVNTVDYIDYVQALPQTQTIKGKLLDERGKRAPETKRETWTLYMSVGGRIKMLQAAQELNQWQVDFRPEMHTPDGCPTGYLEFADRLVYREYCVISKPGRVEISAESGGRTAEFPEVVLGSKPGTAWVKRSGGSQAAGSNPYEKVETSARGRSIAAWGFGVLPGSGVASLEEMQGATQNRRDMDREERQEERAGGSRKTRDELLQETLLNSEQVRQIAGLDEAQQRGHIVQYLTENLGIRGALITDDDQIDWSMVKDGQLAMLNRTFKTRLAQAAAAGEMEG